MDEFLEVFGGMRLGTVVLLIALLSLCGRHTRR